MTSARSRSLVVAATCLVTLFARPCVASERGYDVWFAGRVLSVDPHRGHLRIARGPTETAGRAVEDCIAHGTDLTLVRPGMDVAAQADTRRRPWRVLHLRVMERKRTPPQSATPEIAFATNPAGR